jgi:hypothetical protein
MKLTKHPALTSTLNIFYGILLLTLILFQFNQTNALLFGFVLLTLLFLVSYLGKNVQLSQSKLLLEFNQKEVLELRGEKVTLILERNKYREAYMKTQTQSGKYQNENITLKAEIGQANKLADECLIRVRDLMEERNKMYQTIKDLESRVIELSSELTARMIADQPDIPVVHFVKGNHE